VHNILRTRGDEVLRGGASASGSTTPSIPAGHQAVTAPTSGLTFAIPEDWEDLNALPEAQKALLARAQGVDPSTLTQRLSSTDAFYGRFSQSGGISFNSVAVAREAETSGLGSTSTGSSLSPPGMSRRAPARRRPAAAHAATQRTGRRYRGVRGCAERSPARGGT